MKTITLPDFWVLFNGDGRAMSSSLAVSRDGTIICATAEAAWADVEPRKRDRESQARRGYQMLGIEQVDWLEYWDGRKVPAPVAGAAALV